MEIAPILNHQINNQKYSFQKKKQLSFKGSYFENFNDKYDSIKMILRNEIDEFINNGANVTKLGEGIGGETYRFNHPQLGNLVIKKNKSGYFEDYSKEYNNLSLIPTDKIGGQEAVARVQNCGEHYLVSTFVSGKYVSKTNRYTEEHLNTLFDKMFELDKLGIYHGDLNGKNILIDNDGSVNFIDYQWAKKINKINFFDNQKSQNILLPLSEFPENAQMFEMATMPWYLDSFDRSAEKEQFVKTYLNAKSNYHKKRYDYIKRITKNWAYPSEKEYIKEALESENAKATIYKKLDSNILNLEMKKFQFLSDYRQAYSHVDPNLPNRNILASPSAYICSLSSVQDFRKEVQRQLKLNYDRTKTNYLKSMSDYGDYWYKNLTTYTKDTYEYVMRMARKSLNYNESPHRFYINERNPRIFNPNLDLLSNLGWKYKPMYESNFDVPAYMLNKILELYQTPVEILQATLNDEKSMHKIEKLKNIIKKSKDATLYDKHLDSLNLSEFAVLKVREFRSYVKHHISSYVANETLCNLLENTVNFSERLFNSIFQGLQYENPKSITIKGYENMRRFLYKI